jgi:hypothetical protein
MATMRTLCLFILLVCCGCCVRGAPLGPHELDETGEPEWNFPTSDKWTLVNLSNVYGHDYEDPKVRRSEGAATEQSCQAACAADDSCVSFCFTTGSNGPKDHCAYIDQCWLRSDAVWHPHVSHSCAGVSGYKGTPIPGPTPGPAPAPPAPPSPPAPPPPANALNVLFVIFDDLRPNSKAWGLDDGPSMPNVDKLAAKSVIFDHAYCNQAVCGPSRASLLSGRRPDTTQMWNFKGGWRETPGAQGWRSWPEWAKDHGYTSYGCGKLYVSGT